MVAHGYIPSLEKAPEGELHVRPSTLSLLSKTHNQALGLDGPVFSFSLPFLTSKPECT